MQILNLPPFSHRTKESEGKTYIFDDFRKKFVFLSPEEWVRQHLLHYLVRHKNYPKTLIKIESGLKYNKLQKRSDVLVYDRNAKPFLLAECKSSDIKLDEKTVKQISTYNMEIGARFLLITNGMDLYCWERDEKNINFLEKLPDLPS